jgi:hypothetical protein
MTLASLNPGIKMMLTPDKTLLADCAAFTIQRNIC